MNFSWKPFVYFIIQVLLFGLAYYTFYLCDRHSFVFNSDIYRQQLINASNNSVNIATDCRQIELLYNKLRVINDTIVKLNISFKFAKYVGYAPLKYIPKSERKKYADIEKEFQLLTKKDKALRDTFSIFSDSLHFKIIESIVYTKPKFRKINISVQISTKSLNKEYHPSENISHVFFGGKIQTLKNCYDYAMNEVLEEKQELGQSLSMTKASIKKQEIFNYCDFIYFSIITSTTIGYGDILPNSTMIRMIVSLQSLISICITIFFLNSASKQRSKQASDLQKKESEPK
jgi:hypothetical protein